MEHDAVEVLQGEHRELEGLFGRVSSPDEDRPTVLKEIMQRLATHLDMEKQELLPVLRDRAADGPDVADGLAEEHRRVERILTLLERRKVNSPDVPDLVSELLDINQRHAATAESTVFPALRSALDAHELAELGRQMTSDERRRLTHSHPALPDSGPVASVSRKVAEVVDKARDRSTDVGRTSS